MRSFLKLILVCTVVFSLTACDKDNGIDASVQWIDLGLPSGLLWADRNIGAPTPNDFGHYFAWGETAPKAEYWWRNYRYCKDSVLFGKYCSNLEKGYNGYADTLTRLEACDDAATVRFGQLVHTPTREDWQELLDNTTVEFKGNGLTFTGSNGKSIFMLITGYRHGPYPCYLDWDGCGYYMSSSLVTEDPDYNYVFFFSGGNWGYLDEKGVRHTKYVVTNERCCGYPVRAVRAHDKINKDRITQ